MSDFVEIGNSLINATSIDKVELNEDATGVAVTYGGGKYLFEPFLNGEEAKKVYSEIKAALCGASKTTNYAVSYFSGNTIGLDVFEDVPGKLTAKTIKQFAETIGKCHGLNAVSVLGVIPLEG